MYYDLCNSSLISAQDEEISNLCNNNNSDRNIDEDWPMERVVSAVVPVFFGVIGLAGLLGNALVIVGKLTQEVKTGIFAKQLVISDWQLDFKFTFKIDIQYWDLLKIHGDNIYIDVNNTSYAKKTTLFL